MKKPQRLDLVWEQSHNHKSAFCKDMEKPKLVGGAIPMLMRTLALAKMTDVTLISGDFNESFQMFYPQLSLLFNHNSKVLEFFGVYTSDFLFNYFSDYPNEEDESIDEPCFCIRRVTWDKLDDLKHFQLASNKIDYILSEKQTTSNVIFLNRQQCPELLNLIPEGIEIIKQGIKIEKNEQEGAEWVEKTINISTLDCDLTLNYPPHSKTNTSLEEWITKLCHTIKEIPSEISYLPDDEFRISYISSLFDIIETLNTLIEKYQES